MCWFYWHFFLFRLLILLENSLIKHIFFSGLQSFKYKPIAQRSEIQNVEIERKNWNNYLVFQQFIMIYVMYLKWIFHGECNQKVWNLVDKRYSLHVYRRIQSRDKHSLIVAYKLIRLHLRNEIKTAGTVFVLLLSFFSSPFDLRSFVT